MGQRVRVTKAEALQMFRECLRCTDVDFRGDSIAKREAFNDYVDGLNKDGLVTDKQANTWSNPY